MENKQTAPSLRRSLLTSLMSLVVCSAMFVGTTFAWFTDSVTSANNIIKSGNLDIELEYLNAGEWKPVTETTNVFMEETLWEPGHTETVYLKVSNVGSLSFNYKLGVNIVEEVKSTNVYGNEFKLSDYIMMAAVEDVNTAYENRDAAIAAYESSATKKAIASGYAQDGVLYALNDTPVDGVNEEYVALIVYMPEEVGNEANYMKGAPVPTITLGINLLATQFTYEKDSFDEKYDEDANVTAPPVPSYNETIEATVYDVFDANRAQEDLEVPLVVYEFVAEHYVDAYPLNEYKDWTCDFFVSTDSPVEEGLILFGNYGSFGWLGFWVPENDQPYEPVGLLGVVTSGGESNWTYQDIHDSVQIFRCGLFDYDENNAGVKVTVDLRMTSPDKAQTIVVRSITVTL